jgi:hypothetical protein
MNLVACAQDSTPQYLVVYVADTPTYSGVSLAAPRQPPIQDCIIIQPTPV